ncbi:hypothetical protein P4S73_28875 [Paraglaciecola sp. Hal342]
MIPSITDSHIEDLEAKTGLIFDQERRQAIKEFVDIQACPGSGKTTLIAAKLILSKKIGSKVQVVYVYFLAIPM